ncbi:uncharacterized protein MYCFIDRAFT_194424 [Pseudocercospora fijiensis CIRAD86]|uniref:Uncharacterized protein n=1 Tax=Pseudocercospora fijiensis (strain CIRAD86) TaxID=383855 RepID=M3A5E0_PSEFD|nr:uncharacterized protein MYCFIDRAFT_194424 [Pseudocercospora fijiensis CIRAD86]EME86339.1 hypothetical protein MYCFIDRAFT_194424 [Pseudocercospora fijiensis CIRAD86]
MSRMPETRSEAWRRLSASGSRERNHGDDRLGPRPHDSYELVDCGRTPMLYPPASYQQESSLREYSGRHPTDDDHLPTSCISPQPDDTHPCPDCDMFDSPRPNYLANERSAIAIPRIRPTDSDAFTSRYSRRIPELNIDMYDLDESQVSSLDKGDDRMYHFGHKAGGTYSGTFVEDEPLAPEIQAIIEKMLDKKKIKMRNEAGAAIAQHTRILLSTGSTLFLERTTSYNDTGPDMYCKLPGCLSRADCIPPATYFFALRQRGGPVRTEDFCLCLACMEWLWKGNFAKVPRHPGIVIGEGSIDPKSLFEESAPEEDDTVTARTPRCPCQDCEPTIPQIDGTSDSPSYNEQASGMGNLINTSKHAPRSPELQVLTPGYTQIESDDEEDTFDSPRSMDSNGEWFYPPTRFQYIAAFVKPGVSLTQKEKSAVWLWKAASQDQLRWNRHMRDTECRRKHYSGLKEAEQEKEILPWERLV